MNSGWTAAEGSAPHVLIRETRSALRMTQAQLARRAGLPQSHVAKIESGRVDVQLSTLRRILQAMFCEVVVLPKFIKTPKGAVAERIKEVARRKVARVMGAERPRGRMVRALIRAEEERLVSRPSSEIWRDPPHVRIVEREDDRDALRFWLAQPPQARIDAMEFLRRQALMVQGKTGFPRLERSFRMRSRRA
ncbi:MAG: helix-turn-helix domain-containing protein [Elusimicrobiota bacterium]